MTLHMMHICDIWRGVTTVLHHMFSLWCNMQGNIQQVGRMASRMWYIFNKERCCENACWQQNRQSKAYLLVNFKIQLSISFFRMVFNLNIIKYAIWPTSLGNQCWAGPHKLWRGGVVLQSLCLPTQLQCFALFFLSSSCIFHSYSLC